MSEEKTTEVATIETEEVSDGQFAVSKFEEARRMLAEATSIPDIMDERDKAQIFRDFAARRGASLEVLNDAARYKLDCERRAGTLLGSGGVLRGRGRPSPEDTLESLESLGVSKINSSRWQKEASVDEETYEAWCREHRANGIEMTSKSLLKLAKGLQTQKDREALASETAELQEGMEDDDAYIYDLDKAERLFGMVRSFYVDPPWEYDDATIDHSAASQYPTMSVDQLKAMGPAIKKLAHTDGSFLWLWITWPMIRDGVAQQILGSWGFSWKGEVIWNKMRMGMGRWLRVQTEVCILATRGAPKKMRNDCPGYLEVARTTHSSKPVEMYKVVESFGAGEYLELFNRGKRRDGWNVFGNADSRKDGDD